MALLQGHELRQMGSGALKEERTNEHSKGLEVGGDEFADG